MNKNNKAFLITKDAKHTKCVNCKIEGLENEGFKTTIINSKIYNFKEKHPTIWKSLLSTFLLTLLIGIILLIIEYSYFIKS